MHCNRLRLEAAAVVRLPNRRHQRIRGCPLPLHSRWQLQLPTQGSNGSEALFIDGLLLVSEPDGSIVHTTAYHEDTGTKAWSRDFTQTPVDPGGILLAGTSSTSLSAYRTNAVGAARAACPPAITRINPMDGTDMWTSQASGTDCGSITASTAYVIDGTTILDASTGVTIEQLSTDGSTRGWAFGSDILVQDGNNLQLDALHDGALQPKWKRETQGYTVAPDYPQIILSATTPADGPRQYWLISSATGANTRSFLAVRAVAVTGGVVAVSRAGQLTFLSGSQDKIGPTLGGQAANYGLSYSDGIIWEYNSPNGYSTGSIYASAADPASFKILGRLVTTQSQVSAEGNDSYVVSDGQYAAIIASPVAYVFKL